jgi:uncharacterized protein (DUF1810 family)
MFEHFLEAQAPLYRTVVGELARGEKRGHWMWFIFPQLAGLGRSETSQRFGLAGIADARNYLADETLGGRLRECTELVLRVHGKTAGEIFGSPDDLKFRSSMTLFSRAAEGTDGELFRDALESYYDGEEDALTLELLGAAD